MNGQGLAISSLNNTVATIVPPITQHSGKKKATLMYGNVRFINSIIDLV